MVKNRNFIATLPGATINSGSMEGAVCQKIYRIVLEPPRQEHVNP